MKTLIMLQSKTELSKVQTSLFRGVGPVRYFDGDTFSTRATSYIRYHQLHYWQHSMPTKISYNSLKPRGSGDFFIIQFCTRATRDWAQSETNDGVTQQPSTTFLIYFRTSSCVSCLISYRFRGAPPQKSCTSPARPMI